MTPAFAKGGEFDFVTTSKGLLHASLPRDFKSDLWLASLSWETWLV